MHAFHVCFPARKSLYALFMPIIYWLLGSHWRHRTRCHYGTPKELGAALSDYYLEEENLPPALGGTWSESNWTDWIDQRIQKEASTKNE
jgi:hypothetical protein